MGQKEGRARGEDTCTLSPFLLSHLPLSVPTFGHLHCLAMSESGDASQEDEDRSHSDAFSNLQCIDELELLRTQVGHFTQFTYRSPH